MVPTWCLLLGALLAASLGALVATAAAGWRRAEIMRLIVGYHRVQRRLADG